MVARNGLPLLAVSLLLAGLPAFFVQRELLAMSETDPMGFSSAIYVASYIISLLTGFILQATIVRTAVLDLSGRRPEVGQSLLQALKLLLPMIGIALLSSILIGLGLVLLVVPGIIAYIMLIVAVPVLVEERGGVAHALQRSRELTKGSRWRIFLLILVFLLAWLIVYAVAAFAISALGLEIRWMLALVEGVSAALIGLLMSAMLASLYLELRTVKEGATTDGLALIFA